MLMTVGVFPGFAFARQSLPRESVETHSVSEIGLVIPSRVQHAPAEGRYSGPRFYQKKIEGSAIETPST